MQYWYTVESRLFIPPIQLEISEVKLQRWTKWSETHFGLSYREVFKVEAFVLVAKPAMRKSQRITLRFLVLNCSDMEQTKTTNYRHHYLTLGLGLYATRNDLIEL